MQVSSWALAKVVGGVPCPGLVGEHDAFNHAGIGQTPLMMVTPPLSSGLPRHDGLLMRSCPHPLHPTRRYGLGGTPSKHGRAWMLSCQQQQRQQPSPAGTNNSPAALLEAQRESSTSSGTQPAIEDRAERMFAIAGSLHLRRHRSRASRRIALKIFRETLRLRPAWKETDTRFAVESGIDDVFQGFSCEYVQATPTGSPPKNGPGISRTGNREDVRRLRSTLARIGYNARTIQRRFGISDARRLPGPYYLLKNLDHNHAAVVASMGPAKDALDVAIRLFLLGVALPRAHVEGALGLDFLAAVDRLGMVGECPVDPLLMVSLVQLFPLDGEALLPPTTAAAAPPPPGVTAPTCPIRTSPSVDGDPSFPGKSLEPDNGSSSWSSYSQSSSACSGSGGCGGVGSKDTKKRSEGTDTASGGRIDRDGSRTCGGAQTGLRSPSLYQQQAHRPGGTYSSEVDGEIDGPVPAETATTSHAANWGVVAASDMVFATDWPPPGSTALTEEPVMYIGPDSIGLVQHVPPKSRRGQVEMPERATVVPPQAGSEGGSGKDLDSQCAGGESGDRRRRYRAPEEILDLCSGSGVQGIAAAVLRGGEASVTCVDINPRAVRFSRFNALLNGLNTGGGEEEGGRFRAVVGDLYGALDSTVGDRFSADRAGGLPDADGDNDLTGNERGGHQPSPGAGTSGATPTTRTPASSSSSSLYDLILANPPFVPVPPRLASARRRYDVFASGGSNGEKVIEGIFRGAFDRLRPGSGLLAMVSELANPRTFDAKLRCWIGGEEGRNATRSDQCGVVQESIDRTARGKGAAGGVGREGRRETDGVGGNENAIQMSVRPHAESQECKTETSSRHSSRHSNHHSSSSSGSRPPEQRRGDVDGNKHGTGSDGVDSGASRGWVGTVLHERQPWTAREYAERRAGSPREAEGWERHLRGEGIEEMAAGFVFVRRGGGRRPPVAPEASSHTEGTPFEASEGGRMSPPGQWQDRGGVSSCAGVGEGGRGGAVEVEGVEKLWAPHNAAAVQHTKAALMRLQNADR
ncbi:unnamed protein product [Ectocarpus sp. CCAP 1310/34]|nr:unnamed protein product [Ectocarpus sp. CCAP 1310/34]